VHVNEHALEEREGGAVVSERLRTEVRPVRKGFFEDA
jgi:hypothetical protein